LHEQRRIAEILSTWDSAIEQTERLIDAKQRRKKALMQQLLTGKKRFAEFEGEEWRHATLGKIARVTGGTTPSTTEERYWGGKIPFVTPSDITSLRGGRFLTSSRVCITDCAVKETGVTILKPGTVL